MTDLLFVGVGGFIGAASRYGVVLGISRLFGQPAFPWGVLAVNVLGSLLIGALTALVETRPIFGPSTRLLLFTGILGGFTTFSAITNDTLLLFRNAADLSAAANVIRSVALGLAAAAAGYASVRAL